MSFENKGLLNIFHVLHHLDTLLFQFHGGHAFTNTIRFEQEQTELNVEQRVLWLSRRPPDMSQEKKNQGAAVIRLCHEDVDQRQSWLSSLLDFSYLMTHKTIQQIV